MSESSTERVLTGASDEDTNDEAVHSEHTSHDDGDDGSEEKVRVEDGHCDDTDARLGSTVSGTEVGEDKGGYNTHRAEENCLVGVTEG